MLNKIENGRQLGIEKRIKKGYRYFWYSYAVQKKEKIYYVYECEIAEDNMAEEIFEYENINRYLSIKDVKRYFPNKYGIKFEDINVLKGQRIFNINFYIINSKQYNSGRR